MRHGKTTALKCLPLATELLIVFLTADILWQLLCGRPPFSMWGFLLSGGLMTAGNSLFLQKPRRFWQILLLNVRLCAVWIPLLIPRTELTSFFHNYAFFFPAYLLGMFYSMNRDLILAFIAKHIKILVAFSLVFTALLGINAYEEILPNIEAAYYMQKIAIGACVVHFLEKIKHIRITLLDLIATYSFALYFLHDFILFTFQNLLFTFFGILLPESLFFVSLFTFFCEVALCLLLIMGIKKLLGRRSRYVIGS